MRTQYFSQAFHTLLHKGDTSVRRCPGILLQGTTDHADL